MTFEHIWLPLLHCLHGGVHEQPGELSGVDALLSPLVHPVSHAHAYDAAPAAPLLWLRGTHSSKHRLTPPGKKCMCPVRLLLSVAGLFRMPLLLAADTCRQQVQL